MRLLIFLSALAAAGAVSISVDVEPEKAELVQQLLDLIKSSGTTRGRRLQSTDESFSQAASGQCLMAEMTALRALVEEYEDFRATTEVLLNGFAQFRQETETAVAALNDPCHLVDCGESGTCRSDRPDFYGKGTCECTGSFHGLRCETDMADNVDMSEVTVVATSGTHGCGGGSVGCSNGHEPSRMLSQDMQGNWHGVGASNQWVVLDLNGERSLNTFQVIQDGNESHNPNNMRWEVSTQGQDGPWEVVHSFSQGSNLQAGEGTEFVADEVYQTEFVRFFIVDCHGGSVCGNIRQLTLGYQEVDFRSAAPGIPV